MSPCLPRNARRAPRFPLLLLFLLHEKTAACSGCRARKIGCSFAPGATVCIKCTDHGRPKKCTVQEHGTRSCSNSVAPPSKPTTSGEQPLLHGRRTTSQSTDVVPDLKRQRRSSSREPENTVGRGFPGTTGDRDLHPIVEHDEADALYDPDYSNVDIPLDYCHGGTDPAEVLSVITGGDALEFDIEPERDGYETRSQEDFDLDGITMGSDEDGSASDLGPGEMDDDDDMSNLRPGVQRPYLGQGAQYAPAKWIPPIKPVRKGKAPVKPTSSYDPATCVFKIPCAVHRTQGSKSSNIPFHVSSYITLNKLRITVAEKLDRFPGLIKLQYQLDCKVKTPFTSIQLDEELDIFIETMRSLIVPPRLANGKPSTRPMKAVTAYFDDAGSEDTSVAPVTDAGSCNKVGTRGSALPSKQKPSSSTGDLNGADEQQKLIKALQKRWMCNTHSRGTESPVYCYSPAGSNICYPLSHNNIAFWALQVMDEKATIDKKLPNVAMQTVRPRTRNMGHSGSFMTADQTGQIHTPSPYAYPPPPVIVMPAVMLPWPEVGQGYQGGNGMLYPSFPGAHPMALPSHMTQAQPAIPQPRATTPIGSEPYDTMERSGSLGPTESTPTVPVPDIIPWFNFLEQHEKKPLHGVSAKFGDFGPILERKGFVRISQLSRDYVPVEKLQEWLGIEYGMAVLIFQYVDSDMQAISSGQPVLPSDV
ncbi:hypothetical protein HD554DRAFT_2039368 [Boletus coccyginus]|nr:hypothetical protein HD554DRAFT_2039368 [Boletus coccyginus]